MKQIWKYVIEMSGSTHTIPEGGKILFVGEQHGKICVWVEIDTEKVWSEFRQFAIYGTGHPIYEKLGISIGREYIGTVKLLDGNIMCHVYEYYGPPNTLTKEIK